MKMLQDLHTNINTSMQISSNSDCWSRAGVVGYLTSNQARLSSITSRRLAISKLPWVLAILD
jgi:hypothetical protein